MVNPLIFGNTIHRAKQKRKRDTSFVIRCIARVRFFNYLTKFYSPFIKLPPPTCRDYHPQTIWGAAEGAAALPAPGHAGTLLQRRHAGCWGGSSPPRSPPQGSAPWAAVLEEPPSLPRNSAPQKCWAARRCPASCPLRGEVATSPGRWQPVPYSSRCLGLALPELWLKLCPLPALGHRPRHPSAEVAPTGRHWGDPPHRSGVRKARGAPIASPWLGPDRVG